MFFRILMIVALCTAPVIGRINLANLGRLRGQGVNALATLGLTGLTSLPMGTLNNLGLFGMQGMTPAGANMAITNIVALGIELAHGLDRRERLMLQQQIANLIRMVQAAQAAMAAQNQARRLRD